MPTHFKRNGYKTLAAGKIFHKGTSDVKGYEYWDEERPKYKLAEKALEDYWKVVRQIKKYYNAADYDPTK